MRSLAAESDRAYQGGPLEQTFYQEAFIGKVEGEADTNLDDFQLPDHYTRRLDWFAVDLEGEHSAMDGGILEEHAEYVVHTIHRVFTLKSFVMSDRLHHFKIFSFFQHSKMGGEGWVHGRVIL